MPGGAVWRPTESVDIRPGGGFAPQVVHKGLPCRRARLDDGSMPVEVAGPTVRSEAVEAVGIATLSQRGLVVNLQCSRDASADGAAPAIPIEGLLAHDAPTPPIDRRPLPPAHPATAWRAGAAVRVYPRLPTATARIEAAAASSRERSRRPPSDALASF